MSRVKRPRSTRFVILAVVVPLTLVLGIVSYVGVEIYSRFDTDEHALSGEYLAEANEVLGWEDPCEAFAAADLVGEIGVSGTSETDESSPGEFETPVLIDGKSLTEEYSYCDLNYDSAGCGQVDGESDEMSAFFDIDVYVDIEKDDARSAYETSVADNSDNLETLLIVSDSDIWRDGRVYGYDSDFSDNQYALAIALADFYRVEVSVNLIGDADCFPSSEEIAAIITEKYLPTLHDSIESRLEEAD